MVKKEKTMVRPVHKAICPRCKGNGYIIIPNKSVEELEKKVTMQCPMCDSQGELTLDEKTFIDQFNPGKFN